MEKVKDFNIQITRDPYSLLNKLGVFIEFMKIWYEKFLVWILEKLSQDAAVLSSDFQVEQLINFKTLDTVDTTRRSTLKYIWTTPSLSLAYTFVPNMAEKFH